MRYSEHGVAKAVNIQRKRLNRRKAPFVHDWKKAYGDDGPQPHHAPSSLKRQTSRVQYTPHWHSQGS